MKLVPHYIFYWLLWGYRNSFDLSMMNSFSASLEPSYEISNVIIPLLDKEIEATESLNNLLKVTDLGYGRVWFWSRQSSSRAISLHPHADFFHMNLWYPLYERPIIYFSNLYWWTFSLFPVFPYYRYTAMGNLIHVSSFKKKTYLSALRLSCITPGLQFSLRHVGSTSMTRDQTRPSALGAWSLSHWTTREVSICHLFYMK